MIIVFFTIFFIISSNIATATIQGETLICDKDTRGYNFVTKDKVEFLSIDFEELKIISIHYSYHINDNSIFINKPTKEFYKEKKYKDYVNGDWSRKFLWSCEIIMSDRLKKRLQNKIDKLKKVNENKVKEQKYE
jgi:hypothetical protein